MAKHKFRLEVRAETKLQAWELRTKGRSYREIAVALGIGHETARRYVEEVWKEKSIPLASQVRAMEYERLTSYLDKLDSKIECADLAAIALAVKISERLCRMTGADIPTTAANAQVDQVGKTELEIMGLIQQVQARNQATLERISRGPVAAIEGELVSEAEVVD